MTSATPIPIAYGPRHPIYDQPIPKNSGERLWLSRSTVPFIAMTMALLRVGASVVIRAFSKGNVSPCATPPMKMGKVSHQSEDTASGRSEYRFLFPLYEKKGAILF